jgi:hypothetical protein
MSLTGRSRCVVGSAEEFLERAEETNPSDMPDGKQSKSDGDSDSIDPVAI